MSLASSYQINKKLGNEGEQAVGKWLEKKGFTIRAYNYKSRTGEIDIIAYYKDIVAFVEVKVRTTEYFNNSLVVNHTKQQKIIKTALFFCATERITDKVLRFDVALLKPISSTFEITYIENAFTQKEW